MDSTKLENKTVVITGANCGIGKATAIGIAQRGARVILACRSQEKAEAARDEIVQVTGNENVEFRQLDLSSLQSVRDFAEKYNAEESRLDILICNAGLIMQKRELTMDGFEVMFGVNHLGHFLLTNLLLDKLKACAPSRIVILSSLGHEDNPVNLDDLQSERNFSTFGTYGRSKSCNILFAVQLAKLLAGTQVTSYAVHPGLVETNFVRLGGCLNSKCCRSIIYRCVGLCMCMPLYDITQGARTSLYCSLEPSLANESGKYYSDSKETAAKPHAWNEETAEKLWAVSEQLCGLK